MYLRSLLLGLITIIGVSQAMPVSATAAPAAKPAQVKPAITPSVIRPEHVKTGHGAIKTLSVLSPQLPSSTTKARMATAAAPQVDLTNAFLTRPYMNYHAVTSVFDHCNPDYSVDGKVCRYDGAVAYRSNGSDPSFSLGYAQTPGGGDYLYYDGHNGWDLALNYENVMAAAEGTVRIAGIDPVNTCFGQNVVIDHPNGFSTRYAHLSAIYVSQGQSVTRGQVLGLSGNTGCSSGPHLHFGVYVSSTWNAIDPWGWQGAAGADPWPYDQGDLWLTGDPQNAIPSAPQNVTATAGNTAAAVSWAAPSFTAGNSIVNYTVTASPGGATVTVPANALTATVGGLTDGTSYTFTVAASSSVGRGPASAPSNAVTPTLGGSIFYFAEGYTGAGFTESISLLMPEASGTAIVDYYTQGGHSTATVALTAGQVANVDVNAAVGANQQVAVRVMFPAAGIAERAFHFNMGPGRWYGTSDKIGASHLSTEWDFAEGSTYSSYSEYVTLENPSSVGVTVDLNYFTDGGAHPTKTLTLAPSTRTTVEVFSGDLSNNGSCAANNAGANCGVGRGIGGVSLQVKSRGEPIVAERTLYVNNYSFGSGGIRDGDAVFGANAPATQWTLAEGTTLPGFNEFLSLENPGTSAANVTINYLADPAHSLVKQLTVPPLSRFTVSVAKSDYGVGPGVVGVSAQVNSSQPIVVERPMYIVHDFGSGLVSGADDAMGSTSLAKSFQFLRASTATGSFQYLTVANPGSVAATITATYVTPAGAVTKTFPVPAGTRQTVALFTTVGGPGPGIAAFRIALTSDQPVLMEKPGYSTNDASFGATDTIGYSPGS